MSALLLDFITAVVIILIFPICLYHLKFYKIKKFLKNFPSPPGKPISGHVSEFKSTTEFLKKLHEYRKEYGGNYYLKFGPGGYSLVSSDYKFLEFVLSTNKILKKSPNLSYLEPWIGTGLITADGGPKWKTHRRLITPAFHFKILEQFLEIFETDGDILVEKLSKISGNTNVDIYPYLSMCTLDAICETAMGTKINVQNDVTSSYFESVRNMCKIFVVRTFSALERFDFFFKFTENYKIQQKSLKILHDYTNKVIDVKRRKLQENNEPDHEEYDDVGRKKKKAFLDLILHAKVDGQGLTKEEIREEVDTFMFAGHDTTATASSFILFCIAHNKEVQDKVLEEQQRIFGENLKDARATYSNLQKMKYLESVIKESLRLYSPVPFFGREVDQDVEYDGMIIPKGVRILIFAHGIHMNPKYYPDPEKFDPSRFENSEARSPYAYIPFSAGSRNCIGQKFAYVELKSLVSKIVRNFKLFPSSPEHKLELVAETVLKSLNGVKVGLKLR